MRNLVYRTTTYISRSEITAVMTWNVHKMFDTAKYSYMYVHTYTSGNLANVTLQDGSTNKEFYQRTCRAIVSYGVAKIYTHITNPYRTFLNSYTLCMQLARQYFPTKFALLYICTQDVSISSFTKQTLAHCADIKYVSVTTFSHS